MCRPLVLVTGGARRIGREICRHLHRRGCDVIIHCNRSTDDARALQATLRAARPNSAWVVSCDLTHFGSTTQDTNCRAAGSADAATSSSTIPTNSAAAAVPFASLVKAVEGVLAECGPEAQLRGIVHNASSFFRTPIGTATLADWNSLMGSNAQGPFFLTQALLPLLRRPPAAPRAATSTPNVAADEVPKHERQRPQGLPAIVSILDIHAADQPFVGHSVYCMAKAAHRSMVQSLALELARPSPFVPAAATGAAPTPVLTPPDLLLPAAKAAIVTTTTAAAADAPPPPQLLLLPVRVNGVAPGAILFPEGEGALPADECARITESIPLGRLGSAEDIAGVVEFLLLDAPYVTGQVLAVDGGRSLTISGG